MALGSNNQQNNKGSYEATYYSRLRFKNDEDGLTLGFSFWKGILKLSVTENNTNTDSNTKPEELAYIHLSPTKAKMMVGYVQDVLDGKNDDGLHGVNTGASDTQGLLVVSREHDSGIPYIIIAKIAKDGSIVQSQRFNFNNNYHYGLEIHDLQHLSFEKQFNDDIELEQFREILEDYARSSNGAIGYSSHDVARYEVNKMNNLIWQIAEKNGIERKSGGGNRSGGNYNDSVFANNGNKGGSHIGSGTGSSSGYSAGSIEDFESEFNE